MIGEKSSPFPFDPANLLSHFQGFSDTLLCGLPNPVQSMRPGLPMNAVGDSWEYLYDASQRTILFWDAMRKRGNGYHQHRKKGKPPILVFDYEMLIDGRSLEDPCNYALLRILPEQGITIDPAKRAYVIVDPRAGHGPGIGGFKEDSQVGVAMRAGHPVYFISFFPEPVPGQNLGDVGKAEALFIREVAKRHPEEEKPVVIGNCQAGWAVAALAAVLPDIMGPIVLNGAPLSYWAGADGKNPMRYAGGLLGGTWLAYLMSDLGNGKFDGAHLVANFENLNPANTLWSKQYHLYSEIDTEEERYLRFEKWWGSYFLMNAEEIQGIVSELFIGNKLQSGGLVTESGEPIDLRNIQSPIVVFASWGDNITPPQQALNWIIDVYGHENEIIRNGQTIVYTLHETIGHLGIFVSGSVAKKEHAELVESLEMIEDLPPGLYEMVLTEKTPDISHHHLVPGDYTVRFEVRTIDNIRALDDIQRDEEYFSSLEVVSNINERLYQTWVSPWVRVMNNEAIAEMLRTLHPLRLQHYFLSDLNPFAVPFKFMAESVKENRKLVSQGNYFLGLERDVSQGIVEWLNGWRDFRDDTNRHIFKAIYGPLGLGAIFPTRESNSDLNAPLTAEENAYVEELMSRIDEGGLNEAVLRMTLAAMRRRGAIERRSWLIGQEFKENKKLQTLSPEQAKKRIRDQWLMLHLDEDRALQALAKMLPTKKKRLEAVDIVTKILMAHPEEGDLETPLAKKVLKILDVDLRPAQESVT